MYREKPRKKEGILWNKPQTCSIHFLYDEEDMVATLAEIMRKREERARILWEVELLRQFEAIMKEQKKKKESGN